jgi:ABC-type transport system involved in multi-copper enzyme maturation permease subunit
MRPHIRSEAIKLTSTRTIYGLVVAAVAVAALITFSTISSVGAANLTGELHAQPFFLLISTTVAAFAAVLGVRTMTDEFRYGTIVSSMLASGQRGQVITAKAVVAGIAAAGLAALAQAAMAGIAALLSTSADGALQVRATDLTAVAGMAAAAALWAALGVGVGALVRHQVAAIVGAIMWVVVIENLIPGLLGTAGRYLPGQAGHALAGLPNLLAVPLAAAVLTAYAVATLTAAHLSTAKRDL